MYRLVQMVPSGVSTARMRCLGGQAIRLRLSRMEVSNRFRSEIAAEVILSGRERTEEEFGELCGGGLPSQPNHTCGRLSGASQYEAPATL